MTRWIKVLSYLPQVCWSELKPQHLHGVVERENTPTSCPFSSILVLGHMHICTYAHVRVRAHTHTHTEHNTFEKDNDMQKCPEPSVWDAVGGH